MIFEEKKKSRWSANKQNNKHCKRVKVENTDQNIYISALQQKPEKYIYYQ